MAFLITFSSLEGLGFAKNRTPQDTIDRLLARTEAPIYDRIPKNDGAPFVYNLLNTTDSYISSTYNIATGIRDKKVGDEYIAAYTTGTTVQEMQGWFKPMENADLTICQSSISNEDDPFSAMWEKLLPDFVCWNDGIENGKKRGISTDWNANVTAANNTIIIRSIYEHNKHLSVKERMEVYKRLIRTYHVLYALVSDHHYLMEALNAGGTLSSTQWQEWVDIRLKQTEVKGDFSRKNGLEAPALSLSECTMIVKALKETGLYSQGAVNTSLSVSGDYREFYEAMQGMRYIQILKPNDILTEVQRTIRLTNGILGYSDDTHRYDSLIGAEEFEGYFDGDITEWCEKNPLKAVQTPDVKKIKISYSFEPLSSKALKRTNIVRIYRGKKPIESCIIKEDSLLESKLLQPGDQVAIYSKKGKLLKKFAAPSLYRKYEVSGIKKGDELRFLAAKTKSKVAATADGSATYSTVEALERVDIFRGEKLLVSIKL